MIWSYRILLRKWSWESMCAHNFCIEQGRSAESACGQSTAETAGLTPATRAGDCAHIMYSSLLSTWCGESPNGLLFFTLEVDF